MSETEPTQGTEVPIDADTSRTRVQTYVPAYQKARWADDADEMSMSLSEFVRCMTQAGRRGFDAASIKPEPERADPRTGLDAETVRKRARAMLEAVEPLTFDEMHTLLVSDLESTLDDALIAMQDDGEALRAKDGYCLAESDSSD